MLMSESYLKCCDLTTAQLRISPAGAVPAGENWIWSKAFALLLTAVYS